MITMHITQTITNTARSAQNQRLCHSIRLFQQARSVDLKEPSLRLSSLSDWSDLEINLKVIKIIAAISARKAGKGLSLLSAKGLRNATKKQKMTAATVKQANSQPEGEKLLKRISKRASARQRKMPTNET